MKIVCCSNMPFAEEAFSTLGDVTLISGADIAADDVRDADILAIRSTTKIDESLLDGSSVRFVGTATIGINHIDTRYLDRNGIAWCSAPGCNANSVAEYVTAALLYLSTQHGVELADRTLGVIGVGNVGSLVAEKAEILGLQVLKNDPPKARLAAAGENTALHDYLSLDVLLKESDILTFHVPLTKRGKYPTYHMADIHFFAGTRKGTALINCARGSVVDTKSLVKLAARGRVGHTVMDTWEDEPDISWDMLEQATLATPHIAGHSLEGKVVGTKIVYDAACAFLGLEPAWSHEPLMPPSQVPVLTVDAAERNDEQVLHEIVSSVYDISADDCSLRALGSRNPEDRPDMFYGLRNHYHVRREFRFTQVTLSNASDKLRDKVKGLGFVLKA